MHNYTQYDVEKCIIDSLRYENRINMNKICKHINSIHITIEFY